MNTDLLKEIEDLYYKQKLSVRQVAVLLNISANTVRDYLNDFSSGTRGISEACLLRTTDDYRIKIGLTQQGENNTVAILNDKSVLMIRREYEEMLLDGYAKTQAQRKLGMKYNVKRSTISDVVLRRTWKHI